MVPAVLALGLVLAGCGQRPDAVGPGAPAIGTADGGAELRGKTFVSTAVTDQGQPRTMAEGTKVELKFTADGLLNANAGCNMLTGPVRLDRGTLTMTDLSITDLGCDPVRHQQDEWLSAFLDAKPSWKVAGEELSLSTPTGAIVLAQQRALPLIGTQWQVDTLVDGQTAGSVPAGATFVFSADKVTITGLCNLREVPYQAAGTTLTFELGPMTLMACAPEIMTVESAAVAAFSGAATYRIETNTLTITNGDKGLRLLARP
ncbi:META domain-containing protein [Actinokineospora sp.]|uniref:META domain-containing protein n=1 Tax=Actinokineospora sp. TaxID=1872133 RepID=UPI004037B15B